MVPCTLSLGKTWERQATFILWFGNRSTMTHLCTFQPSRNDGYIFERYKIVLEREWSKSGLPKRCASCWILDSMIETKRKTCSFESLESKKDSPNESARPSRFQSLQIESLPGAFAFRNFSFIDSQHETVAIVAIVASPLESLSSHPSHPLVDRPWLVLKSFENGKVSWGFVLPKLRTCFVENSLLLYSWRCWMLRWRMWRITNRSELVERIVECIIPKTSAWTPLAFLVFSWYILGLP